MFKLPEAGDYFKRVTPVAIPNANGGYHRGKFIAKFRYMPQAWLDKFTKPNGNQASEDQEADQFLSDASEEEQIDMIKDVLYGFSEIEVGDRELDDTNPEDRDYLIKSGPYSMYFRVALIQSFFQSITGARDRLSKKGN